MKHLHRLAVYTFVLLLSTALNIGVARAVSSWGSTETAATVGKSAKKTKNNPQQQHEPTPTVLVRAATVSVAVLVLVLFVVLLDDADAALVFALVTPARRLCYY